MRKFCLNITVLSAFTLACVANAQDTPPVTAAPQYFTLNLPAGASLISAPLDTGQGLARDAFLGLPPQYPLFFGWNSASQDWVSGDQVPAGLAGGYWVYLPTPTTLVVAGQPYTYFTSLTTHVDPGWHLFGVPFQEGIGWKDFHLHASGNPVSLDRAVELGWINPDVTTMQGSEVQFLATGQPLQPGAAYWVKTSIPLELRADRPPEATPVPAPNPANPAAGASPAAVSDALLAQPRAASGDSTSGSVLGWLGAIAEFLVDAAKGAALAAEGNFAGAGFEWAAGTFGLVEYGIDGGDGGSAPPDQLTQMDAKLDTLIVGVNAIQGQLNTIETNVDALRNYLISDTHLGIPLTNADVWLDLYYRGPRNSNQSREWARWKLAGCDTGNLLITSCPETANKVTAGNYSTFQSSFIEHPGSLNNVTDDFPLWWAYSVLGGQNGVQQYGVPGTTADGHVDFIYHGLTDKMGTSDNALWNAMHEAFLASSCVNDTSPPIAATATANAVPGCDLLNQVYLPMEALFLKAIGDQTQLAGAQAEAKTVLAEKHAKAKGVGLPDVKDLMAKINGYLNQETEAFLQVAEYIALYRAADGTMDWNNFGSSDAGVLLARADFVAAQLAGQNYQTSPSAGYVNPPWPSQNVVGRVFYVNTETPLAATATRGVCTCPNPTPNTTPPACVSQAFCANPAGNIAEDGSNRAVTNEWPYLLWTTSSGASTGTPATNWKVQRLKPMSLPTGLYAVNSTLPERLGAILTVETYDSNFNNVSASTAGAITFGSLNGIEGPMGHYGLKLGEGPWTTAGGKTDISYQYSASYSDNTHAPGAAYLNVVYPPIPQSGRGSYSGGCCGLNRAEGSWSASANIKIDVSSQPNFTKVRVHWPTTVSANLNSTLLEALSNIVSPPPDGCDAKVPYYSFIDLKQQLLDDKGTAVASADKNPCSAVSFPACNSKSDSNLNVGSVGLTKLAQYTFKASFSSETYPYATCFLGGSTWHSAVSPSAASWLINAPSMTLTKQ